MKPLDTSPPPGEPGKERTVKPRELPPALGTGLRTGTGSNVFLLTPVPGPSAIDLSSNTDLPGPKPVCGTSTAFANKEVRDGVLGPAGLATPSAADTSVGAGAGRADILVNRLVPPPTIIDLGVVMPVRGALPEDGRALWFLPNPRGGGPGGPLIILNSPCLLVLTFLTKNSAAPAPTTSKAAPPMPAPAAGDRPAVLGPAPALSPPPPAPPPPPVLLLALGLGLRLGELLLLVPTVAVAVAVGVAVLLEVPVAVDVLVDVEVAVAVPLAVSDAVAELVAVSVACADCVAVSLTTGP